MAIRSDLPATRQPEVRLTRESRKFQSAPEPHLGRINMWESDTHLVIATPVPGVQPGDLRVRLEGTRLEIEGRSRAPHMSMESQHVPPDHSPSGTERYYYVREWLVGSFARTMELPMPVDPEGAEASLGNGVLVVALRKSTRVEPRPPHEFRVVRRDFSTGN